MARVLRIFLAASGPFFVFTLHRIVALISIYLVNDNHLCYNATLAVTSAAQNSSGLYDRQSLLTFPLGQEDPQGLLPQYFDEHPCQLAKSFQTSSSH